MLVHIDSRVALLSARGIQRCEGERGPVPRSSLCRVGDATAELARKDLSPDASAQGVAERRANVVAREVQTGDDGDVFVLGRGLDAGLGGVREESSGYAQQDLRTDYSAVRGLADTGAEVDEEAERHHEENGAEEDEGLETAHAEHD